jgi:hypothetical protein
MISISNDFGLVSETHDLSGIADKLLRTRTTSPSCTISATFSGTWPRSESVVILGLLVERSSISGEGANLDVLGIAIECKDRSSWLSYE